MKLPMILLLFATGAFFSCKQEDGNIVLEGQGDGSQYNLLRTQAFTLKTSTVLEDSLPGNGLSYNLIGSMNDGLLGKSRAAVYAASRLLEPSADFPNTLTPDSAVLFIPIIDGLNYYGDRNAEQVWKVYPLLTSISASTVYYQNSEFQYDNSFESSYRGKIFSAHYDSVNFRKGKIYRHPGVKIRLSDAMALKLMQMPKAAYQSDDGLASSFKGLAIIPQDNDLEPGRGGVGVYDISGENSIENRACIMLYYNDTSTFVFTFAGKNAVVTTGITGPFPEDVKTQLQQPAQSFTTTYVQALSGVKTRIELTDIYNLVKDGPVAINKAEIVFKADKSSLNSNYFAPLRLNLFRPAYKGSSRNYILKDAGTSAFGGIYDPVQGTYTFNITRHVQDLLTSYLSNGTDKNYGLFLTHPTAEPVLAGRVAIDHTQTQLIITYTKLN